MTDPGYSKDDKGIITVSSPPEDWTKEIEFELWKRMRWIKSMADDEGMTIELEEVVEEIAKYILSHELKIRDQYNELIMAVGNKYPGETRHQTALRYIKQAEKGSNIAYTSEKKE